MVSRRHALGLLAAAATGGCAGSAPVVRAVEREGETDTAAGDRICRDGSRLDVVGRVVCETREPFRLSSETASVAVGETFRARLVNRGVETRTVGVASKFDVQRETDGEWQSIYRYDPPLLVGQTGLQLPPGRAVSWELQFTRSGLTNRVSQTDQLVVPCEELTPGQYRFVFWGLEEPSIAVRFEVTG